MIDLRFVKKLVAMIDASTVDSIEITSDKGMKIRISKSSNQRTIQLASPVQLPPMMQSAPAAASPSAAAPAAEAPPRVEKPKVTYLEVKSPMVGTYYSAPEPGARPYLTVGDRISKGQILCIIEAMKIMNEIESEFDGVVKEILAQNSHPVEYGQVLFRVDPNG
jgi:acetyl-CoA carboxylase biotin carboxyl carrier protein